MIVASILLGVILLVHYPLHSTSVRKKANPLQSFKEAQRASWGAASHEYGSHMLHHLAPVTGNTADLSAPRAPMNVLDVATGSGMPALFI